MPAVERVRCAREDVRVDVLGRVPGRDLRPLAEDEIPEDTVDRVGARPVCQKCRWESTSPGMTTMPVASSTSQSSAEIDGPDLDDRIVLDQHVALAEFADRGVDADDGAALIRSRLAISFLHRCRGVCLDPGICAAACPPSIGTRMPVMCVGASSSSQTPAPRDLVRRREAPVRSPWSIRTCLPVRAAPG